MIKKMVLLGVAVLALAGLGASAAQGEEGIQWKMGGQNLTTNGTVVLKGNFKFANVTLGSTECPVEIHMDLVKGTSTAEITNWSIQSGKTSSCVLTGALKSACTGGLIGHETTNLPWDVTGTSDGTLHITTLFQLHTTFSGTGSCPATLTLDNTSTLTLKMNNTTAFTTVSVSGTLTATSGASDLGTITMSGTFTATEGGGTYGIGK